MRILSFALLFISMLSAPPLMAAKVKRLLASDMVNDSEIRCVGRLALVAHRLGKSGRTATGTPLANLSGRLNAYGPEVGNRALGRYKTDAKGIFAAFGALGKAWEADFDRAPEIGVVTVERECLPAMVAAESARIPMRLSQCAAWQMGDSSDLMVAGAVSNAKEGVSPAGADSLTHAMMPAVVSLLSSFQYRRAALAELKAQGIDGPAASKIVSDDAAAVRKERALVQKGKRFSERQDQHCAQQFEKFKPAKVEKPATGTPVKAAP